MPDRTPAGYCDRCWYRGRYEKLLVDQPARVFPMYVTSSTSPMPRRAGEITLDEFRVARAGDTRGDEYTEITGEVDTASHARVLSALTVEAGDNGTTCLWPGKGEAGWYFGPLPLQITADVWIGYGEQLLHIDLCRWVGPRPAILLLARDAHEATGTRFAGPGLFAGQQVLHAARYPLPEPPAREVVTIPEPFAMPDYYDRRREVQRRLEDSMLHRLREHPEHYRLGPR